LNVYQHIFLILTLNVWVVGLVGGAKHIGIFHSPRVWGHIGGYHWLSRFEPRARSRIFLGFSPHTKGYIVFYLKSHAIKVSRNVLFYEDVFPSCYNINDTINDANICLHVNEPCNSIFDCDDHIKNYDNCEQSDNNISTEQTTCPEIPQRKSTRTKSIPSYLKDYHIDLACIKITKYPTQSYISLSRLSTRFQQVTISIDSNHETKTYKEAVLNWKTAMGEELAALDHNKTWTIVGLPTNNNTVVCKWFYKLKHKADKSIERYKARLVA